MNAAGTILVEERKPWLLGWCQWEERRVETLEGREVHVTVREGRWRWRGFRASRSERRFPPTGTRAGLQPRLTAGGGGRELVDWVKSVMTASALWEEVLTIRRGELAFREAQASGPDRRFWAACLWNRERGSLTYERFTKLLQRHGVNVWRELYAEPR